MSERQAWPELVGKPVDEAIAIIQNENPNLNIVKLKEDSVTTHDLRRDRVRIFYDNDGNVASEPYIG